MHIHPYLSAQRCENCTPGTTTKSTIEDSATYSAMLRGEEGVGDSRAALRRARETAQNCRTIFKFWHATDDGAEARLAGSWPVPKQRTCLHFWCSTLGIQEAFTAAHYVWACLSLRWCLSWCFLFFVYNLFTWRRKMRQTVHVPPTASAQGTKYFVAKYWLCSFSPLQECANGAS